MGNDLKKAVHRRKHTSPSSPVAQSPQNTYTFNRTNPSHEDDKKYQDKITISNQATHVDDEATNRNTKEQLETHSNSSKINDIPLQKQSLPSLRHSASVVATTEECTVDDDTHSNNIEQDIISSAIPSSDHNTANPDSILNENETTQSTISISTEPNTHPSDHNRNDMNTIDGNECAIVSNIQSTNGDSESNETNASTAIGNTNDCIPEGEESMIESMDDEGFDSNNDSNTGDWCAFNEDSYDGQDYIKMKAATPPSEQEPGIEEDLVPNPASTDNGKCSRLRPVVAKAECRAWICEHCHALNNLMDSMKRNYGCIVCDGKYRPGQTLIESKEQDEVPEHKEVHKCQANVWYCDNCSRLNPLHLEQCTNCHREKPAANSGKLITFATSEYVNEKSLEDIMKSKHEYKPLHKSGANKVKKKVLRIMSVIGTVRKPSEYPRYHEHLSARVRDIFGTPYRISLYDNWKWPQHKFNGMIKVGTSDPLPPLKAKCIAINQKNGYIALIQDKKYIMVLCPEGATQYIVHSYYLNVTMLTNDTRIRFVGDKIYVFDNGVPNASFLRYRFDEENRKIYFIDRICDEYFGEVKIKDFVLTDELLIILFTRWIGIYKINPKLDWYHAVAYAAHHPLNPSALEMCVYDDVEAKEDNSSKIICKQSIKNYIYILIDGNIIALHPTNPTFEYLHYATKVPNCGSFCNSKKYGTFFINQSRNKIMQSAICDKDVINHVCTVYDVQSSFGKNDKWFKMRSIIGDKNQKMTYKDATILNSVVYDEGYGISGRLLINCTVRMKQNEKEISVFYQVFNEDELMLLKKEIQQSRYPLKKWKKSKPFNFVVFVFEMLYGSDLVENI